MSLLDSEASEASDLSDEEEQTVSKNRPKHRTRVPDSSEDEEVDAVNEEDICRKEGEGWIVDEEDEDIGGSGASEDDSDDGAEENRKDRDDEDDDALDDEDFQLIKENVGIDLKKKKRRLILDDDEDESEGEAVASKRAAHETDRGREEIARQIFEDEDDEDEPAPREATNRATSFGVTGDEDEEEEDYDDMGDFIVEDKRGEAPAKTARRIVHKDAALQQAQDIFGVDFDMSEFEAFRKGRGEGEEYSEESEIEYSDDEESASAARRRPRKARSNMVLDDKVYELFDPSDLERAYYSQADERIRKTDLPERFQLRSVAVQAIDPSTSTYSQDLQEISDEANWIYRRAFTKEPDIKANPDETQDVKKFDLTEITKSIPVTMSVDPLTGRPIRQRQARTTASYEIARRAGLADLVQRFGLSAAQFAENVQDQYMRHDVDQCPMLPLDAGGDFLCPQFSGATAALSAARYMLAFEISREPFVRRMMRQMFQLQAVISVKPTSRGRKEIDESHPLSSIKYLNSKPVTDLMDSVLFLHLHNASREKLLTYEIHVPNDQICGLSMVDELQRFFHQDEFSSLVQAWNEQRNLVLKQAAEEFIFPVLIRELRDKMLEASQQAVLRMCAKRLFNHLQVAPYPPDGHRSYETDTETAASPFGSTRGGRSHGAGGGHKDPDSHGGMIWSKGARVLALALKDEDDARQSIASAVQLDSHGEVVDFLHFHGLLQSKRVQDEFKKLKDSDMQRLSSFMIKHRPQVLVIGCDCRRALYLQEDVQRLIDELASERRFPRIHVELMEAELSIVFAQSSRASADMPSSYSPLLRQAISLGRRLQDPLAEFAQLVNTEDEILGIRWHPLQDSLARDKLIQALEIEFINRVNEVGVDVNRCLSHPHTAGVLQFVSGLGPRKSLHLLKILRQKKTFLTNRMQLVTVIEFGPRVVINCAGFIKIDTEAVRDLDAEDVEILDSTRVHPESYDLAKKMAVDALEYDDTEEYDPTVALEDIVQSPTRLRELDLDAFAEELRRHDHGDKHITLYDIRKELNHRYRDYRSPYQSANPETIFSMVTHETPETFHVGRLIECNVSMVATRRPRAEQLDNANPTKNEANGLWMCPFCRQDTFQLLNHVWSHFDSNECPGTPVGLRLQLDNGISGFLPLRNSDPPSEKLFEKSFPGSLLRCRVLKIDITKFNVELTCKESDLKDERHLWRNRPDAFYDYEAEEKEQLAEETEKAKRKENVTPYLSRVIFHPYFKNVSYDQLAAMEPEMEPGSIVIRPSRKGTDHLTLSWKVDDGIMQHIDVVEREKINNFSLGKLLIIGDEEFEDLDEIVARHVQPMISLVRDIVTYRYYRDSRAGDREVLGSLLLQEKGSNPDRIPYFLSATKERPGYFVLAYMPNKNPHFELFSVRPEGFRFRRLIFPTLDRMVTWFKEHYNDVAGGKYIREWDYTRSSPRAPRTPQIGYGHNSHSTAI